MSQNEEWYSSKPEARRKRREAADTFLNAVLDDANHLGIVGFGKHRKATAEFQRLGKIKLPKNVRVICLEADTKSRSDLVIFALRKKPPQKETQADLWRQRWIAAWEPY